MLLQRDFEKSYNKKCEKISGLKNEYTKLKSATDNAIVCIKNSIGMEVQDAKSLGNYSQVINK